MTEVLTFFVIFVAALEQGVVGFRLRPGRDGVLASLSERAVVLLFAAIYCTAVFS